MEAVLSGCGQMILPILWLIWATASDEWMGEGVSAVVTGDGRRPCRGPVETGRCDRIARVWRAWLDTDGTVFFDRRVRMDRQKSDTLPCS